MGALAVHRPATQLGPVLRVDTTGPVDAQAVIAWIQAQQRYPHPTG
jgi:hypothetical protein